jgi:hypothetical protein
MFGIIDIESNYFTFNLNIYDGYDNKLSSQHAIINIYKNGFITNETGRKYRFNRDYIKIIQIKDRFFIDILSCYYLIDIKYNNIIFSCLRDISIDELLK